MKRWRRYFNSDKNFPGTDSKRLRVVQISKAFPHSLRQLIDYRTLDSLLAPTVAVCDSV